MAGVVLIGGGTGFIGTHLVNLLKQKGYGAIIVSRMPSPNSISWTDLSKTGLPKDVCAVVNLAGQNVLDPTRRWTDGFKQNVFTSRVNTTQALAEAISQATIKPQVFVTIAGVGIYPTNTDVEYNEDSPVADSDFFSKLCHSWEAATLVDTKPTTRTVIIRSGVVLGKNGGMIKNLWLPFYLGLGGPVASGNQFLPWIHIEDMARLIVFSIESQNINGVLNGVAPQLITNKEFSQSFGRAMWRPSFIPIPVPILNLAFSEERAKMLTDGLKVQPKRVLEAGFEFSYPTISEACRAIVRNE